MIGVVSFSALLSLMIGVGCGARGCQTPKSCPEWTTGCRNECCNDTIQYCDSHLCFCRPCSDKCPRGVSEIDAENSDCVKSCPYYLLGLAREEREPDQVVGTAAAGATEAVFDCTPALLALAGLSLLLLSLLVLRECMAYRRGVARDRANRADSMELLKVTTPVSGDEEEPRPVTEAPPAPDTVDAQTQWGDGVQAPSPVCEACVSNRRRASPGRGAPSNLPAAEATRGRDWSREGARPKTRNVSWAAGVRQEARDPRVLRSAPGAPHPSPAAAANLLTEALLGNEITNSFGGEGTVTTVLMPDHQADSDSGDSCDGTNMNMNMNHARSAPVKDNSAEDTSPCKRSRRDSGDPLLTSSPFSSGLTRGQE